MPSSRIVLPLDVSTTDEALALATPLRDYVGVFKVGLELFVAEGPSVVRAVAKLDKPIFLDLKLHDIPETVDRAVGAALGLGVSYLTVHASGGREMLGRAVERANHQSGGSLRILAVTMLTSLSERDAEEIGVHGSVDHQVARLAALGASTGVHGFVCAPGEASTVREIAGKNRIIVTPGIRPSGSAAGDQQRVATPAWAIANGADLLVVGRPIRDAKDRIGAARAIAAEIELALERSSDE